LGTQVLAVAATMLYAFVGTFILLKIIDGLFGLRVPEEDEVAGLDLSQHNEKGYDIV